MSIGFHSPIKYKKLETFVDCEVKKKPTSSYNKISQSRVKKNVFGQFVRLAIKDNIDLELTLSFPLGPVPWSLGTADSMTTKTGRSTNFRIFLESNISQLSINHPIQYI